MNGLRLYGRYISLCLRSKMEYRMSFVMLVIGNFVITGIDFLALYALFARFQACGGWRVEEVALLYGLTNCSFALSESFGRGFGRFSTMIRLGTFDRILLRPRSTILQIAGSEVQPMRIGRFIQGGAVLCWALCRLDLSWTIWRVAIVVASMFGGACLFLGLFILQATLSFWTVESLELMNTVTYGGTEAGSYPLHIYDEWFGSFFTFIVPLAFVNYLPVCVILGKRSMTGGLWAAPAVGLVFLMICTRVWGVGVRHYRSTGS